MAMVEAVRGGKKVRVSESAFEAIYRGKGFRILGDKLKEKSGVLSEVKMQDDDLSDVDSIPISDMSKEQLAEYAKRHNIDTSSAKTVSEARKIVKNVIRGRKTE